MLYSLKLETLKLIGEEKVKWLKEIWNGPKDVHWYLEEVEAEDMTQACTAEPVSKKKII